MDLCWQSNVSAFNMLSRLVITFLPRSKRLLISWLPSTSAVILESPKMKSRLWYFQWSCMDVDCEEGWAPKNWGFWTVVLEKTLESPLDCKEIQPVHSEADQPWDFFGRNDAKAETLVLWPPHAKSWLIGKDSYAGRDWGKEEKGTTKDEMAGRHHRLDGCKSEWTPGDGDEQGGLACCDSWGRRVGHAWATELNTVSSRMTQLEIRWGQDTTC